MTTDCGRWLVAADDITGAAEIAGAACSRGFRVRLIRDEIPARLSRSDQIVVLDTDTRSLDAEAAAARTERLLRPWLASGRQLVFKKTDSVLRGNVAAELRACLRVSGLRSTLLISANPSRGRTIVGGKLFVGNIPLHETDFARDPEHPAKSSDIAALLGVDPPEHAHLASARRAPAARIITVDVQSSDDLADWARRLRADELPAGGVDYFSAWLNRFDAPARSVRPGRPIVFDAPILTICGSRSIAGRLAREQLMRCGGAMLSAPHDLAATRLASRRCARWAKNAADALEQERMVILETARVQATPATVRQAVANSVGCILQAVRVRSLLLEGGATASAILHRMGWHDFEVLGEIDAGTVALRVGANQPVLVLKPGTYRWPTGLLERIARPADNPPRRAPLAAAHSSVIR